jgi:hypothetical protein
MLIPKLVEEGVEIKAGPAARFLQKMLHEISEFQIALSLCVPPRPFVFEMVKSFRDGLIEDRKSQRIVNRQHFRQEVQPDTLDLVPTVQNRMKAHLDRHGIIDKMAQPCLKLLSLCPDSWFSNFNKMAK